VLAAAIRLLLGIAGLAFTGKVRLNDRLLDSVADLGVGKRFGHAGRQPLRDNN
jgi:hypothetical protein